jgi:hypothetical protein
MPLLEHEQQHQLGVNHKAALTACKSNNLILQQSNHTMAEHEVATKAPESDAAPASLPTESAPEQTGAGLGVRRPSRDLAVANPFLRSIA